MTLKLVNKEGETILNLENFSFKTINPYFIKDRFQKKLKTPNIKVFENISILQEIDFVIYAQQINKKQTWAKRQKYELHLRPTESPVESGFIQLKKLPLNHLIEIDSNNSKVRLSGPFVHPTKSQEWRDY